MPRDRGPLTSRRSLPHSQIMKLDLLADSARNSEIARQLGMTDKTVRNHVSAILMKLQVPDRTAAAIKARDAR